MFFSHTYQRDLVYADLGFRDFLLRYFRAIIFSSFLSVSFLFSSSQVKVTPNYIQYGVIGPSTDRVTDILIRNTGDKQTYVLRTDIDPEFEFLYTSKTIEVDSTVVLRVKFKPRVKGKHDSEIRIFVSTMDVPVVIDVRADVQYLDLNDNIPCPDFSKRIAECCPSNMFMAEVVDDVTNDPIEGAQLRILEQEVVQLNLKTSESGLVSQFVPIGYYEMIAEKPGYDPDTIISYVNRSNHFFRFRLTTDSTRVVEEEFLPVETLISFPTEESLLLPESIYNANNIVFLVDISQSMAASDKMDLMKTSLIELTSALRPIDRMGLVSYASDATILLPSTTGDRLEQISVMVHSLDPGGSTAGARGFKTALKEVQKNYIDGGNNQLIVITDGAFQTDDQEGIRKLVEKYKKKNIRTSIVGIHSTDYATRNLTEFVEIGSGSFVPINDEHDSREALIEEIRKMSRKN